MRVRLLVPANIRHNSGGNVFNTRLAEGLRALGVGVDIVPVDGSWPAASAKERRRLGGLLGAWEREAQANPASVTLVDGLIACGAPAEIEYAAAAGQHTWILLHMPSPSHPDAEKRALRAAAGVICSSSSAAAHVAASYGLNSRVALPGTDAAPLARGSVPPHIIAVAALLPNKDQLLIVAALALLQDLPWSASLVGTDDADPAYAARVRSSIASHGLGDRVRMTGQLDGQELADQWNRADLSLLVSRAEAFGLVVTESLARGIPVIVRDGTGAVDALRLASSSGPPVARGRTPAPGAAVPAGTAHALPGTADALPGTAVSPPTSADALPGSAVGLAGDESEHPEVLAALIRRWLSDAGLRTDWRAAAVAARDRLPGWDSTAQAVLEILEASLPATRSEGTPTAAGSSGAQ